MTAEGGIRVCCNGVWGMYALSFFVYLLFIFSSVFFGLAFSPSPEDSSISFLGRRPFFSNTRCGVCEGWEWWVSLY